MHDISGMNPYLWANTEKVEDAGIAAEKELQSEISRLQNLARLNPAIDQSEIKNLQTHQTELEEALAETRFRLDSLHLVVVQS
jgi:ATP-dependent helicase HepA